jgi:uncharacterized protein
VIVLVPGHRRLIDLRHRGLVLFVPISILVLTSLAIALDVPPLGGRVNDYANLMPAPRVQSLEQRLAQFETDTGHQIAVLTIPSLQGEDIEGFSIRVAESWKIGKKGFDNGAILVIARKDRKLRIEVGYGLEGVLPDAIASRIINEVIVPRFRDGNYPGGIEAGVETILNVTQTEKLPENIGHAKSGSVPDYLIGWLLFFSFFLSPFIMRRVVVPRSREQGALIGAAIGAAAVGTVGIASLLANTYLPFGLVISGFMLSAAIGAIGGLEGNFRAAQIFGNRRSGGWREPFYSDPTDYRRGRWGGGFGAGGVGESSSGSSFSGGGGGFGGGGASGGY